MSLYETLSVSRDASGAEIKKAYLRLARETHPDKHMDDPEATTRFQSLGRAYAILRDDEKRKLYDETGMVDDEVGLNKDGAPWEAFWRDFYSRVTLDKLDALAKAYKGSDEELGHLKAVYLSAKASLRERATQWRAVQCTPSLPHPHSSYSQSVLNPLPPQFSHAHALSVAPPLGPPQGNFDKIMEEVMHSTLEDEPRFREILNRLISSGELPKYKAFSSESEAKRRKRQQQAEKEAAEAAEAAKELGLGRITGGGGEEGLRAALAVRQQAREEHFGSLIAKLSEKHGGTKSAGKKGVTKGGGKKGKGKHVPTADPLSDADFEAAQARMMAKAGRK